MGLIITNPDGFTIGGIPNPTTQTIYIRANVNMNKQILQYNPEDSNEVTGVSIETTAKTTLLGGIEDKYINVEGILPIYWLVYSSTISDKNELLLEIETELKDNLIQNNPTWSIEIRELGVY